MASVFSDGFSSFLSSFFVSSFLSSFFSASLVLAEVELLASVEVELVDVAASAGGLGASAELTKVGAVTRTVVVLTVLMMLIVLLIAWATGSVD